MKKLTLLFLLIFFHTSFLFAQQNRIDSLLQILKTTTEDSNKLKLLNTITSLCIPNYQKALPYAEEAKLLAEKLPNNKIAAIAYGNLGVVYGYFGFYEKSFDNFLNELRISEELKDTAMIIISNSQLADIYTKAGNYKKALEIALSAEKIVLRTENKKKIARGLWDLSSAYLNLCKKSIRDRDSIFANSYYDKLVDCRSRALIIYKELKDTLGLIFFLNNLGIVFDKCTLCENSKLLMGTQLIRSNYFQLALETYAKAIELSNGIKDSEGVSWAYLNLGDFYKNQGNLFKEKGILSEAKVNFGKSLDFYLKALKIISLLKFPHGIATYNSRVGSAYLKLENPQEAEQYLLAAAKGFKTLGFKEGAKEAYEMLAEANLKKGDYKKTFEFYKNFSTLKDSLFNEEVTKQLAEISFKYETEKKEKENVKLKLDNQAKEADVIKKTNEVRRQRDYKRIFFLAVLALCIIIYLMVRNRRIKIKANKILQRAELLKQQTEIRQNISNDLHDEIGSDLTKITILCTQGQTDLKKQIPISSSLLDEISSKSQELGVNLDDLVWTTDPDNDNFSNLLSRIRTHIHKFLENSTIQSTINLPDNVSSFPISPETNRNIYLILKEGLNNVIKHSQAQNIEIKFLIDDDKTFSLEIRDDGRGFDTDNISIRNGRRIMNKRVSSIKEGDLKLKSEIGIGTTLIISGKLA